MTVNVIDTAFHGSSFPSGYTGPGTLIGNPIVASGVVQRVQGYFTSNGNATTIKLGFRPLKVKVINTTDGLTWEWQYGMPAANSIKTTLGGSFASVQDTASQITVVNSDGLNNSCDVTLGATLNGTAKNIVYEVTA